ncbi:MAG: sodium:proton antiporter NhaD [Arenicella sp.]
MKTSPFKLLHIALAIFLSTFFSSITQASAIVDSNAEPLNLTHSLIGYTAIGIFLIAYAFVIAEERLHLRKSKPVTMAAGLIWALIGWAYASGGISDLATAAIKHNLLEFSELMLFLLVAMTYIAALEERRVFDVLRVKLIKAQVSYRKLFWLTGILAFLLSPVADNLTTALIMCSVVLAVGKNNKNFVTLSCINVVVAANAGGAFSPFGDITTLMVWQKGLVTFTEFFPLLIPSAVNFIVPAVIMSFFIGTGIPSSDEEEVTMRRGAKRIIVLFLLTIITAVAFHGAFHLPPAMGMMLGLSYLQIFGYFLKRSLPRSLNRKRKLYAKDGVRLSELRQVRPFDFFAKVARAEWDTLIFFFGVIMCVGGLGFIGYLAMLSEVMYGEWSPTYANIFVGVLSALVDNIPVMFAVLTMQPDMSLGQWLLVTLTAGVGGSMLSIGSAAGVALMGQARGQYTFFSHLKWSWAIALGYAASIATHLILNKSLF